MKSKTLSNNIDRDDWVKEIIDHHFDPKEGTPFWLKKEKELNIDAKKDIQTFEDIEHFGFFDEDILRNINVEDFVPKKILKNKKKEKRVMETSGTTGKPKRILTHDFFMEMAKFTSDCLDMQGVPKGLNFLMVGPPGGPNGIPKYVRNLAWLRDGLAFYICMDPRWMKNLLFRKKFDEVKLYMKHLRTQTANLIETQNIEFLFTSSKILENPLFIQTINESNIKVIYHGGTILTRDNYKLFKEESYRDKYFAGGYGNTLMGVTHQAWPALYDGNKNDLDVLSEINYDVDYIPSYPYTNIQIVDPENPENEVYYQEEGQVKFTTLNKDFFIPNLLERDYATRVEGRDPFDWDWIRNPYSPGVKSGEMEEGVY